MKEYVFFTFEGYTESPTGVPLENIQILGFECGENENLAKQKLLNNCKWIIESGFNVDEIIGKQIIN